MSERDNLGVAHIERDVLRVIVVYQVVTLDRYYRDTLTVGAKASCIAAAIVAVAARVGQFGALKRRDYKAATVSFAGW
jgi:hypothetical protein